MAIVGIECEEVGHGRKRGDVGTGAGHEEFAADDADAWAAGVAGAVDHVGVAVAVEVGGGDVDAAAQRRVEGEEVGDEPLGSAGEQSGAAVDGDPRPAAEAGADDQIGGTVAIDVGQGDAAAAAKVRVAQCDEIDERCQAAAGDSEERDAGAAAGIGGDGEFGPPVAVHVAGRDEHAAAEPAEHARRPHQVRAALAVDDPHCGRGPSPGRKCVVLHAVAVEVGDRGPDHTLKTRERIEPGTAGDQCVARTQIIGLCGTVGRARQDHRRGPESHRHAGHGPAQIVQARVVERRRHNPRSGRQDRVHHRPLSSDRHAVGPVVLVGGFRDRPAVERVGRRSVKVAAACLARPSRGGTEAEDVSEFVGGDGVEIDLGGPNAAGRRPEVPVGARVEGDAPAPQERAARPAGVERVEPGLAAGGRVAARAAHSRFRAADWPAAHVKDQRVRGHARVGDCCLLAGCRVEERLRPGIPAG